jgi:hypothetical protein
VEVLTAAGPNFEGFGTILARGGSNGPGESGGGGKDRTKIGRRDGIDLRFFHTMMMFLQPMDTH